MRIIIEGAEEALKSLERIKELASQLSTEIMNVYTLTETKYEPEREEKTACIDGTDG